MSDDPNQRSSNQASVVPTLPKIGEEWGTLFGANPNFRTAEALGTEPPTRHSICGQFRFVLGYTLCLEGSGHPSKLL
jgi:hypothetical protein